MTPSGLPSPSASATAPGLAPPPGTATGRLYLPKLKPHWVVVEGVALKDIRYGPGPYPSTAMPGQIGNFLGRPAPVTRDLLGPRPDPAGRRRDRGDPHQLVRLPGLPERDRQPHSIEVIAPTPDHPGQPPTEADMTMTTCNPKFNNYQRMAVHARLVSTTPHDQRPPQV